MLIFCQKKNPLAVWGQCSLESVAAVQARLGPTDWIAQVLHSAHLLYVDY